MIWPVQKTGLPYNIVRFPNGPQERLLVIPDDENYSDPNVFSERTGYCAH